MVKRFLCSLRTGFYIAVTHEGDVKAGDEMSMLSRDPNSVPVSEITRLHLTNKYVVEDVHQVRQALKTAAFPDGQKLPVTLLWTQQKAIPSTDNTNS